MTVLMRAQQAVYGFVCILTLVCLVILVLPSAARAQTTPTPNDIPDDYVWEDNPYGAKVTRWPEESELRPMRYSEWRETAGAPQPFVATFIESTPAADGLKSAAAVGIFVNSGLIDDIMPSLVQYMTDLAIEGYQSDLYSVTGGTAGELRTLLQAQYADGMIGAVLVGDLPFAWYETVCWDPAEHEEFPCDLYYMDLNGDWSDYDSDGLFDHHEGEVIPEIWVGRLTPSTLILGGYNEVELLRNYFSKNHRYRTGNLPVADRALFYIDDDWAGYNENFWDNAAGGLYDDRTVESDEYVTVAEDYDAHLHRGYEFIHICAHSDPNTHYFKIPPDIWYNTISVSSIRNIDPQAAFYNLFACSNARYTEYNYMAGWYIFNQKYGLASIGSTKTGSMLDFTRFYQPLGNGYTLGEAYLYWFTFQGSYGGFEGWEVCWFYGMTLCGDPTLTPHRSACPEIIGYSFDDNLLGPGDGDGIYEAGETVSFRFAVENAGGVAAEDLTLTLSIDDITLTIDDAVSSLGDIPAGGVATNDGSPMTLDIPLDYLSGVSNLTVAMAWNGGAAVDTLRYEITLGFPRVLLVDDDMAETVENYYTSYFEAVGIPCSLRTTATVPTTADLLSFDAVIWFTGAYRASPLNASEIAAMEGYLDAGGNLLLTGQGIAAELATADPDFLSLYLKTEYLSTSYLPLLLINPGAPAFGHFVDTISFIGTGGAANQTAPDHLSAVNGGTAELSWFNSTDAGAVSYAGDYKSIFCGFGLEGAANPASRWLRRDSLFAAALAFFDFSFPNPQLAVTVGPGDPQHLLSTTPDICWRCRDTQADPQQSYQVQVGTDDDWSVVEMWDSGPVVSTDTAIVYNGIPLAPGESYLVRVRVSDGADWTNWHYCPAHINIAPSPPTGLTPDGLASIAGPRPLLSHTAVADGDGDGACYYYEVYADDALTQLVIALDGILPGSGDDVSFRMPEDLVLGEDYYWRAGADDGYEQSGWSAVASFIVAESFVCGDANGDDAINVGDAVFVINYAFKGGPAPDPLAAGDANNDGDCNVGDAVYLINYSFKGGPEPYCP